MFEYPLDLHYSQTSVKSISTLASLNTLWIYTTLKQLIETVLFVSVWIPSGFTLLSNIFWALSPPSKVWIPSGFTLLSNNVLDPAKHAKVWIPSGFTLLSNHFFFSGASCRSLNTLWIYTTLKHQRGWMCSVKRFEYPLDLHYSQTKKIGICPDCRLNTLWIYTTLKRHLKTHR